MLEALVEKIKLNELGKLILSQREGKYPVASNHATLHARGSCGENKIE